MRSSRRTRAQPPASNDIDETPLKVTSTKGNIKSTPSPVPKKPVVMGTVTKVAPKLSRRSSLVAIPVKTQIRKTTAKRGRTRKDDSDKEETKPAVKAQPKVRNAPARKAPVRGKKVRQQKDEDEPADAESIIESKVPTVMDFANLKLVKVINESAISKRISFQGTYDNKTAVIQLERTLFNEEAVKKSLADKETTANEDFSNDIYSSYMIEPSASSNSLNSIKATVICPAGEKVLAKYTRSEGIFFSETMDAYSKVVEPFIENMLASDATYNNWVYNILDGVSEVERVILNDPDPDSGFVITPDLKWAGDEKDLYLLAICHRRDIRSLRDLGEEHMILLKNILTKGTKAIKDKFKKSKGQLRSFIHYQPSFYHFHVHFKSVEPNDYVSTDRDHLLSTVINNITLNKDYYKKATLTYPMSLSSALYQDLKKAKRV